MFYKIANYDEISGKVKSESQILGADLKEIICNLQYVGEDAIIDVVFDEEHNPHLCEEFETPNATLYYKKVSEESYDIYLKSSGAYKVSEDLKELENL